VTAEDILWRRTKLGLFTSTAEQQALVDYLKQVADHSAGSRAA